MAVKSKTYLYANIEGYLNPTSHWKIMLNYVIASRMCDPCQFCSFNCGRFNTYSKYASNK
jgi:hypothetical protein